MRTILILAEDSELTLAWATYLSKDGFAVFTSMDSLEAAEIISMLNIDSVIISSHNPATFLLLGRVIRSRNRQIHTVAITRIPSSVLELLLETRSFSVLDGPFTFSNLKRVASIPSVNNKVEDNAFV